MDNLIQFPSRTAPRRQLQIVGGCEHGTGDDSLLTIAAEAYGRHKVAKAIELLSSASLELSVVNFMSLQSDGDISDQVSEEVLIGICHAVIAIIDAKGSRNDDLPLRRAAMQAIADREGVYHEA